MSGPARAGSPERYTLCTECKHTTNIHNEDGCHAYRCGCKKGH